VCGQEQYKKMSSEDRKRQRQQSRKEEKDRLFVQIDRGLMDCVKELKLFIQNYEKLIKDGHEVDERLLSWQKFFNEISLVSEERTDD
jgi:hypothetical protein